MSILTFYWENSKDCTNRKTLPASLNLSAVQTCSRSAGKVAKISPFSLDQSKSKMKTGPTLTLPSLISVQSSESHQGTLWVMQAPGKYLWFGYTNFDHFKKVLVLQCTTNNQINLVSEYC